MTGFSSIPGLVLTERVTAAMEADHIRAPTAVQSAGIGPILRGEAVLMHSGTGTGKTLAYLLPLLQVLADSAYRAVVMAPGAELAMQTLAVARNYSDLPAGAAISTGNIKRQKKRITKSTKLVVGTPDRLIPMFREGKLKGVRHIVFDELDPILASPHAGFLTELLSRSEPRYQLIVASATMGTRSADFVQQFMADGKHIVPEVDPLTTDIQHHGVRVRGAKDVVLARFLESNCSKAILFVSDPAQQRHLFRYLSEHALRPVTVGREATKQQRQRSLEAFRQGEAKVLITTDAIARGLDVPEVDWVLHYDVPRRPEAYVHRAGRTGRAGRAGKSVVFVDKAQEGSMHRLAKALKLAFSPI